MFCGKDLSFYTFLSLLLVIQTILAIDLKSDDNFRQNYDKKSNLILSAVKKLRQTDDSLELRNRINISVTTDWKANDFEITDQRNESVYLKNIFTKKLMVGDGFLEKYQMKDRKNFGQNERARKQDIIIMRTRTPRVEEYPNFSGVAQNKTQTKLNQWSEFLNRVKRRAQDYKTKKNEKNRNKAKLENKDKKESSISDAFLEMASETFKNGLRGGVRLWNKLKNQINDGFSSKSNDN